MARSYSDAQRRAQIKWNSNNLERLSISFKKGHRTAWEAAAARAGQTLTQWVIAALDAAAAEAGTDPCQISARSDA